MASVSHKKKAHHPLVFLILDGWGIAPPSKGNAIALARTPNFDQIYKKYPHTALHASGKYVGLPEFQAGNSEAGHLNIGSGRTVEQDAVKISKSISQGSFFRNPIFLNAINHVKKNKSSLHLMGLLSNGQSAHTETDHLLALLFLARIHKVSKVFLHIFTDGRDAPTHSSLKLIESLERILKKEKIATIMGRFYSMDRKKNWPRTEQAYNALVLGRGRFAKSPQAAITQSYNRGESDEFIPPYVMIKNKKPVATINDRDVIFFFNLRSDRARQITKAFVQPTFEKMNPGAFKRKKILRDTVFVAMTHFGPDLGNVSTAYPTEPLIDTMPMLFYGQKQMYITEAEKYAHMTYFINGGYPDPVANETRIRVDSPEVKHYDKTPEMAVGAITTKVIKSLGNYDFIAINFSSADMIGHTGNLKATIRAVEHIDSCVGRIKRETLKRNGILVITADHGNAEKKINPETDEILTEHTVNPVPFIIISKKKFKLKNHRSASLRDVLPTLLDISGTKMKKSNLITGKSLLC